MSVLCWGMPEVPREGCLASVQSCELRRKSTHLERAFEVHRPELKLRDMDMPWMIAYFPLLFCFYRAFSPIFGIYRLDILWNKIKFKRENMMVVLCVFCFMHVLHIWHPSHLYIKLHVFRIIISIWDLLITVKIVDCFHSFLNFCITEILFVLKLAVTAWVIPWNQCLFHLKNK